MHLEAFVKFNEKIEAGGELLFHEKRGCYDVVFNESDYTDRIKYGFELLQKPPVEVLEEALAQASANTTGTDEDVVDNTNSFDTGKAMEAIESKMKDLAALEERLNAREQALVKLEEGLQQDAQFKEKANKAPVVKSSKVVKSTNKKSMKDDV